MKISSLTCGLVGTGDRVSLAQGLILQKGQLVDSANGARHHVAARAAPTLQLLQESLEVAYWLRRARSYGLREREASELLMFLNQIAGLHIRSSLFKSHMVRLAYRVRGLPVQVPIRRIAGTAPGLSYGMLLAILPVLLTSAAVVGLAFVANLPWRSLAEAQLWFLAAVYLSTWVHEWVHLTLARRWSSGACVVVRGTRIGILHRRLSMKYEWQSAVRGPLAGSLSALAVAMLCAVWSDSGFALLSVGLVAAFHSVSWLPFYGDGQTLKRLWKFRYA